MTDECHQNENASVTILVGLADIWYLYYSPIFIVYLLRLFWIHHSILSPITAEEEVQQEKRTARLQRYAVAAVVAIVLVLWSYDIWFPATQP